MSELGRRCAESETYGTAEALPVKFPTESLHGLHTVPDALLAPFAFRGAESYVTRLAIRVSLVHGEADIVILKLAIPLECDAPRTLFRLTINARRQKKGRRIQNRRNVAHDMCASQVPGHRG